MATITKAALQDALQFVQTEADAKTAQSQAAYRDGREKDGAYYDGQANGLRVAAMAIESRLLLKNG